MDLCLSFSRGSGRFDGSNLEDIGSEDLNGSADSDPGNDRHVDDSVSSIKSFTLSSLLLLDGLVHLHRGRLPRG